MVCLDTNILIEILREDVDSTELEERLSNQNVCITSVTVFELWCGILLKRKDAERRAFEALLRSLDVLEMDAESAKISAEIYISSRKNGVEIPPLDAMIAGIVRRYGERLVTRDKHFSRIDGLEVVEY